MSKQYGLIIPGQQKKSTAAMPKAALPKPGIFDESSSDSDSAAPVPLMKPKCSTTAITGPGAMERRMARRIQEKALQEDPTVFQYDELYDEMEGEREKEQETKAQEPKKPKYIARLMECAERRKLENELRIERQVQKERETEGEEFKDKESFVTSAYRKKLEEMRQLQEQEKRDEYLESIGDVTKQKDLDGFYRHLYEQKMGAGKGNHNVAQPPATTSMGDKEIAYKPIKSNHQRAYRKRHVSEDEDAEDENQEDKEGIPKKVHLSNNIDADSDFSIDSSSSDEEEDAGAKEPEQNKKESRNQKVELSVLSQTAQGSKVALNLKALNAECDKEAEKVQLSGESHDEIRGEPKDEGAMPTTPPPLAKAKKDKSLIWKKRTVGEAFDEAVKRYYERKAARSAAA